MTTHPLLHTALPPPMLMGGGYMQILLIYHPFSRCRGPCHLFRITRPFFTCLSQITRVNLKFGEISNEKSPRGLFIQRKHSPPPRNTHRGYRCNRQPCPLPSFSRIVRTPGPSKDPPGFTTGRVDFESDFFYNQNSQDHALGACPRRL